MADPRIGRSRILEHLNRIGINQAEYARRIGVSENFVSNVIRGKKKLSLVKSKRSADLFGCHIDDLCYWEYDSE